MADHRDRYRNCKVAGNDPALGGRLQAGDNDEAGLWTRRGVSGYQPDLNKIARQHRDTGRDKPGDENLSLRSVWREVPPLLRQTTK